MSADEARRLLGETERLEQAIADLVYGAEVLCLGYEDLDGPDAGSTRFLSDVKDVLDGTYEMVWRLMLRQRMRLRDVSAGEDTV